MRNTVAHCDILTACDDTLFIKLEDARLGFMLSRDFLCEQLLA